MNVRFRLAATLFVAVGGAACGERSPRTVTVADSAGVRVVTNLDGSIEASAEWTLAPEPLVDIGGGVQPEVPLYRISAVTPLESGDIAVGTTVPPQVLVFDRRGTLTATLGRAGDGPGEFLDLGSVIALPPDSVGVWDPDRRRLSVFTEGGTLEREVDLSDVAPMSARASESAQSPSGFTHVVPSEPGSFVVFGEAALGPGSDPVIRRHEMPAYRVATDGELLASLGSFPGLQTSPGLATPFGARTHAAGRDDTFVVGTSETTELRFYAPTGELTQVVRWPDRDRPIEGPFLTRWMELVEAEPNLRDYVLAAPRPRAHPAYDDVMIGDGGYILVADYPGPLGLLSLRRADPAPEPLKPTLRMPSRRWLVFDAGGVLRSTLTTPAGFEPYALEDDELWGVYTDELDVESVRAYGLTRS